MGPFATEQGAGTDRLRRAPGAFGGGDRASARARLFATQRERRIM
jgi:hypothetical protein